MKTNKKRAGREGHSGSDAPCSQPVLDGPVEAAKALLGLILALMSMGLLIPLRIHSANPLPVSANAAGNRRVSQLVNLLNQILGQL